MSDSPKRTTARDIDAMLAKFRRDFPEPDPTFAEDMAEARKALSAPCSCCPPRSDDPWER